MPVEPYVSSCCRNFSKTMLKRQIRNKSASIARFGTEKPRQVMRSEYGIIPEAAGSNKIRNGNVAAGMNPDIRDSVESHNTNRFRNGERRIFYDRQNRGKMV